MRLTAFQKQIRPKARQIAWLFVVLLLATACSQSKTEVVEAVVDRDSLPSLKTVDVVSLVSDSGVTKYRIQTAEWSVFDKKNPSHWAFEKGLYLESFDSLLQVEACVKADTAYYFDKLRLWKLIGNVHIENQKKDQFDTPLLYWDERSQRIYSDKKIRIEQGDFIYTGVGFESNQMMTKWEILDTKGIIPVDQEFPTDSTQTDSTHVTNAHTP